MYNYGISYFVMLKYTIITFVCFCNIKIHNNICFSIKIKIYNLETKSNDKTITVILYYQRCSCIRKHETLSGLTHSWRLRLLEANLRTSRKAINHKPGEQHGLRRASRLENDRWIGFALAGVYIWLSPVLVSWGLLRHYRRFRWFVFAAGGRG